MSLAKNLGIAFALVAATGVTYEVLGRVSSSSFQAGQEAQIAQFSVCTVSVSFSKLKVHLDEPAKTDLRGVFFLDGISKAQTLEFLQCAGRQVEPQVFAPSCFSAKKLKDYVASSGSARFTDMFRCKIN